MAKKMYVGINDIARKITNAYVGVNGVAKKIVKGYVGVNGVAQLFYEAEKSIPFTSSPAPTSWSGSSTTAANYVFVGTNTYGNWGISSNVISATTSYTAREAVDDSANTGHRGATNSVFPILTLTLPENILICPSSFSVTTIRIGTLEIEGFNASTNQWEALASSTTTSTSKKTTAINTSATNYYSAFRLITDTATGSSAKIIFNFVITTGKIKDER